MCVLCLFVHVVYLCTTVSVLCVMCHALCCVCLCVRVCKSVCCGGGGMERKGCNLMRVVALTFPR